MRIQTLSLSVAGFLFLHFASAQKVTFNNEFVYQTAPFKSCHASTIAETPSGLVAAWFGGTHEKHKDVGVWLSRRINGVWSTPVEVVNGVQHADKRYPCWNPVLYYHPAAGLILFYKVGPDPREWWGEMMVSPDDGQTWNQPRRLPEDIIGPVKNKPELLAGGTLLCPSSTEHDGWRIHMEMTSDWGRTWKRIGPLPSPPDFHAIQPSILKHPDGRLQILCRSKNNRLMESWSEDQGLTWSSLQKTNLPNPNSGTDAVTLSTGEHLLLYNPTETPEGKWGGERYPLVLARSADGKEWEDLLTLEADPGEFSYPSIIEGKDGKVHLVYTWKREKIKYWEISLKK